MKIDRYLFRTGVPAIDLQHEKYLEFVDHLFALTEQDDVDRADVDKALNTVVAYAVEHFDTEEALMRSVNYPGYAAHVSKHNEFRETTDKWCADDMRQIPPDQMLVLLTKWLITWFYDQTQTYDKGLAIFLKRHIHEHEVS